MLRTGSPGPTARPHTGSPATARPHTGSPATARPRTGSPATARGSSGIRPPAMAVRRGAQAGHRRVRHRRVRAVAARRRPAVGDLRNRRPLPDPAQRAAWTGLAIASLTHLWDLGGPRRARLPRDDQRGPEPQHRRCPALTGQRPVSDLKVGDCLVAIPGQARGERGRRHPVHERAHRGGLRDVQAHGRRLPREATGSPAGARRVHDARACARTTAGGQIDRLFVYPQQDSWNRGGQLRHVLRGSGPARDQQDRASKPHSRRLRSAMPCGRHTTGRWKPPHAVRPPPGGDGHDVPGGAGREDAAGRGGVTAAPRPRRAAGRARRAVRRSWPRVRGRA